MSNPDMLNYRKNISRGLLRSASILLTLLLITGSRGNQDRALAADAIRTSGGSEKLVYFVNSYDDKRELWVFDPRNNTRRLITANVEYWVISNDGHLAYTLASDFIQQIYVLDTRFTDSKPIKVKHDVVARNERLSWSPDSRYLAYVSEQEIGRPYERVPQVLKYETIAQIYIWDGVQTVNVTPNDPDPAPNLYCCSLDWSFDGRLAITISVESKTQPNDEIYIWDGKTTTNLSKNPDSRDGFAIWSHDGWLAFVSASNEGSEIKVWDGSRIVSIVSFRRVTPDFIEWSPDGKLAFYLPASDAQGEGVLAIWDGISISRVPLKSDSSYHNFGWTNNGLLRFTKASNLSGEWVDQIFVWDGKTITNLSQYPRSGGAQWIADGRWAFSPTNVQGGNRVYVRDANNKTIFTDKGTEPALSPSGYLAFCEPNTLYVWDGRRVITVAQGIDLIANWQGGGEARTSCFANAG